MNQIKKILVALALLVPISSQAFDFNLKNTAIVAGATAGTIFLGKCIYDAFIKERSDIDELNHIESLFNEIEDEHTSIASLYISPCTLLGLEDTVLCSKLRDLIRNTLGKERPFLCYKNELSLSISKLHEHCDTLTECKRQVLYRCIRLQKLENANNPELKDLWRRFTVLEKKLVARKENILELRTKLEIIENYIKNLPEYIHENMTARLEAVEYELRHTPRIVYVPVHVYHRGYRI